MKINPRMVASVLCGGALAYGWLMRPATAQTPDSPPPQSVSQLSDGWIAPQAPLPNGLLPADTVLPGGHHSLLERWTKQFGLSMEQELWIEPQLHAEESLTKPVLGYRALSADERKQILLIIKLAARRQIRTLLTPAQQKLMDAEIDSTQETGGSKSGAGKKHAPPASD
jgi:hypothetical protein